MLKIIVQIFFIIIGGTIGMFFVPDFFNIILHDNKWSWISSPFVSFSLGALTLFITTFWLADYVVDFIRCIEEKIVKTPITDVLFGTLGLIIGLIISYLIVIPLKGISIGIVNVILSSFLTLLLGYLGFQVGFRKRNELTNLSVLLQQNETKNLKIAEDNPRALATKAKILDTSVIIDGRIEAICRTGFLEGPLVIPQFVLEEVQHVADSSDEIKRNRGRRGLDILNRIQKDLDVQVEIYEGDFEDIQEVDSKLIKLAQLLNGVVVTNDFNLNKVCTLRNVTVLNINDLGNAVIPVVLPGEGLNVQVIKDGKEKNQGIAYLDDGTIIVVEEGRKYIGKNVNVLVTRILQNSAGRMIFAKPKVLQEAI